MSQLLDLALRMDEWMDGRTEPNPWDTSTSAEVQLPLARKFNNLSSLSSSPWVPDLVDYFLEIFR